MFMNIRQPSMKDLLKEPIGQEILHDQGYQCQIVIYRKFVSLLWFLQVYEFPSGSIVQKIQFQYHHQDLL